MERFPCGGLSSGASALSCVVLCRSSTSSGRTVLGLSKGSIVVLSCGLYLGSYRVTPKRNYYGAYG